jgi:hypothetical protein
MGSKILDSKIQAYLSAIGRRGGLKSKRQLNSSMALKMVRLREAKRAFKKYYSQCFWSYDANYPLSFTDISWVAAQLMKNGGRQAWETGARLCR